jgi:hypothetical protein
VFGKIRPRRIQINANSVRPATTARKRKPTLIQILSNLVLAHIDRHDATAKPRKLGMNILASNNCIYKPVHTKLAYVA